MPDNPVGLIACQIAMVRRALRAASSAAECLPALAALVDLASELRAADLDGTGATRAGRLLDEAVRYLRAASVTLPAGGEDHCLAVYLLARACLRRHGAGLLPDVDDAAACLRRLLAALPADDQDRTEVEALLAEALLARGSSADGHAADVDEAGRLLASVLAALSPEHPGRRPVTATAALAFAIHYVGFGGTDADRDAAEAYAAALVGPDQPGEQDQPDDAAATGHLVLAWMALTRQHTAQQRSTMLHQAEVEAARFDAAAAARLLAPFGEPRFAAADVENAIGHLRQIPPDGGNPLIRQFVPMLWGLAQLAQLHGGGETADVSEVAESIGALAADPATAEIERSELLAIRAALLAGQAKSGAGDALGEAASGLPPGHMLRSPVLRTLSTLLSTQVDQAGSANDLSARLEEIATILERLPPGDPEAAHAMATLAANVLNASVSNRTVLHQDRLFAQLERVAAALAPDDPLMPIADFMVRSARHMRARLAHDPDGADAALAEMIRHADLVPVGHMARPFVLASVAVAHMERHSINGELRNLDLAGNAIDAALAEAARDGPLGEGTAMHAYLLYLRGHLRAMRAIYNPSLPGANAAIADLERAQAMLGPAETGRVGIMTSLAAARLLRDQLTEALRPDVPLNQQTRDMFDQLLEAAERAGRDSMEYPVLANQAAGGLIMRGFAARDAALIDRGIALQADVCSLPNLGLRERPRMLELHGQGLFARYLVFRNPRDLGNAIIRFEEARRAVEQEEGSPHAASVLQSLATAYRWRGNEARGDVDRAVDLGLAGLRARAGDVLLQDSDDNALDAARQATNDATEMARWFLAHGRDEAAIGALELGRGMALHAATSGTDVAEALAGAGHLDLAREWTAPATRPAPRVPGVPGVPGVLEPGGYYDPAQDDDLRYRAMRALRGTPAAARLLSSPARADVAAALASSGADVLVYLVPQDDTGPGTAVLVDRAGNVSSLMLIRLRAGPGTPAGKFLQARQAVERAAATDHAVAARIAWLEALTAVCDWAWQAAIGPLLRTLAARAGESFPSGAGHPRRIVLVPSGELGLVPWHAARSPVGASPARGGPDGYDYACRHAVISYASSARQFIDAAGRRARRWAQAPVLISDTADSLGFAMAEVAHLHAAHYASGAVYGAARRLLPDPGTPGAAAVGPFDVLAALPHGVHPGASLVHFGCHGRVRLPVLGSNLRLGDNADGEEISVSVADILRQARTGQAQDRAGGLAVLASCLTDVTEADYDEALSLATAFLAAGCAGVVAARWSVPDAETALFMAAFHRFLNAGDADPAHALRAAQLWMLDQDREVPASWPREFRDVAGRRGRRGRLNLTSIEAWAGFTYQGR